MNSTSTIKSKIKSMYQNLSTKEKAIADLILKNPKSTSRMTINEISTKLGLADSTIFQFARKLGYKGFRDFRNDLLADEFDPEISIHENIKKGDDELAITYKVFESSISSLRDTRALLNLTDLKKAVKCITSAKKVVFFGLGGSNVVAFDAYHKFLRSPVDVEYASDYHIQLMQVSLLNKGDCAIIFSHTGLSTEISSILNIAKDAGAYVIAITSNPSSELATKADVSLISISEETGYRSESLSSRIAQLTIIDSLFTIIMFEDEKKTLTSLTRIRKAISHTKIE